MTVFVHEYEKMSMENMAGTCRFNHGFTVVEREVHGVYDADRQQTC
jgi:hypothetical protein